MYSVLFSSLFSLLFLVSALDAHPAISFFYHYLSSFIHISICPFGLRTWLQVPWSYHFSAVLCAGRFLCRKLLIFGLMFFMIYA